MFPKGMEWIVILIVALLIFGPKNLPKLGASVGKMTSTNSRVAPTAQKRFTRRREP